MGNANVRWTMDNSGFKPHPNIDGGNAKTFRSGDGTGAMSDTGSVRGSRGPMDTSKAKVTVDKETKQIIKAYNDREKCIDRIAKKEAKLSNDTIKGYLAQAKCQAVYQKQLEKEEATEGKGTVALVARLMAIHSVTSAITGYVGVQVTLQQMTISLTNAQWALNDANREYGRLQAYNFQLDVRAAGIKEKLAERQLLVTQRTGRQLDIQMAQIDVEMAQRDISLAKFAAYDKELAITRQKTMADMQLTLVQKQLSLMYTQLWGNLANVIAQTITYTAVTWSATAAAGSLRAISTGGVALIGMAASVAAVLALTKAYSSSSSPKAINPSSGKPPSMQTEVGEIKTVGRTGLANVHQGEIVTRPGTFTGGTVHMEFHITGGSQSADQIANTVYQKVERNLLNRQTLYIPNAYYGVR